MEFKPRSLSLISFLFISFCNSSFIQDGSVSEIPDSNFPIDSVVQIDVVSSIVSYESPWQPPSLRRSGGSGFIIEGNRVLTNAHVVSRAEKIRVRRPSQRTDFEATVLHIAHDCDLAMLQVKDASFFQNAEPVRIGDIPELNTEVVVAGFPIGGKRLSVTRGVVSRIDIDTYSHSEIDSHLTIQVDAAINPGNSGGPAFQKGRLIGVAFQVITGGENLGYLIPTVVVQKFLGDIQDGTYDGYIELGVLDQDTKNPTARRALGVSDETSSGVYVYKILRGSSAEGHVRPGDLIVEVENQPLSSQGDVDYNGRLVSYIELIDHKDEGEQIRLKVLRDGKQIDLKFPAKKTDAFHYMRRQYEGRPEYHLAGGLLFQPLNADLMNTYGKSWNQSGKVNLLYKYYYSLLHDLESDKKENVVLSRQLADSSTLYTENYSGMLVESVNQERIRGFAHFVQLMKSKPEGKYTVIRFSDSKLPLILDYDETQKATSRVMKKYKIRESGYVEAANQ